jgi:LEA14-like dessication related protein
MMRRKLLAVAVLLMALSLPGCMKNSISRMSLELKQVKIKNFSNSGFTANVYMNIKNPNRFGVTVKDLNYTVLVNNREVGKGRIPMQVEIPANGEALAELPLEVGPEFIDNLFKHGVNYRIKGEAVFGTMLGSYTYPFDVEKKQKKKQAGKKETAL